MGNLLLNFPQFLPTGFRLAAFWDGILTSRPDLEGPVQPTTAAAAGRIGKERGAG